VPPDNDGIFVFVNEIPDSPLVCHMGALDPTPDDDIHGYMYYVRVAIKNSELFNSTLNKLCIGVRYEFFAYLGNVVKEEYNLMKPNIHFEVRMTTSGNESEDVRVSHTLTFLLTCKSTNIL